MRGWQMVISGILALACGFSTVSCTTAIETTPRITFEGDTPTWADSASSVMGELEQWRGLNFKENLQVTFQPQDDPGLNGWYNSQTKQLVVTTSGSEELGRGVMLHEMFHALQDQHFDLYSLRLQTQDIPDYGKAVSAVIEGEAMLAVSELMNYDFLAHAQLPPEGPISDQLFENIFLYGAGLKFVQAVRDQGGWAAVDAVFAEPPQATALILNPERYLAGERTVEPIEIPLNSGETLTSETMRGEYAIRLMLARQPETRSLMESMDNSYVTDTLGVINNNGDVIHRWVVELSHSSATESLAAGFKTALAEELAEEPLVEIDNNSIIVEW
ncbi:hypothetical protein N836_21615 [Leptolyngbya sp. Heron Island J]|uniref:hypothetical protein n=1 Tax=Leptolyngbya sp. Heron Island J TaxID=1385935 RepID=UPI0003B9951C|nr:hypothetical protein [Leptolyngbya sp. Heron Island J]ESA33288.1 hypothetical protein N836_21615 [Leptolyngbya sp. Heron Island J]